MRVKALILFLLVALTVVPAALAGGKPHLVGTSAYAEFHIDHPNGCTETDASVYVLDNKVFRPGDAAEYEPRVEVIYSVFGQPTGEPTDGPKSEWCDGLFYVDLHGSAPLADGEFTAAGNLSSATLNKTMIVFDEEAFTDVEITVDVVWTATGPLVNNARPADAVMSVTSPSFGTLPFINPLTPSSEAEIRRHLPGPGG